MENNNHKLGPQCPPPQRPDVDSDKSSLNISFKDGLSIDEAKVSSLVIGFFILLIFSMVMYYVRGDLNESICNILIAMIFSIAGVNTANRVMDFIRNRSFDKGGR